MLKTNIFIKYLEKELGYSIIAYNTRVIIVLRVHTPITLRPSQNKSQSWRCSGPDNSRNVARVQLHSLVCIRISTLILTKVS